MANAIQPILQYSLKAIMAPIATVWLMLALFEADGILSVLPWPSRLIVVMLAGATIMTFLISLARLKRLGVLTCGVIVSTVLVAFSWTLFEPILKVDIAGAVLLFPDEQILLMTCLIMLFSNIVYFIFSRKNRADGRFYRKELEWQHDTPPTLRNPAQLNVRGRSMNQHDPWHPIELEIRGIDLGLGIANRHGTREHRR